MLLTMPAFLRCCATAACLFGLAGQVTLQAAPLQVPPPPADGIRDDARAMSPDARQALAAEMKAFEDKTGIKVVVDTNTYLEQNVGTLDRCRALQESWIGRRPGVVFCLNRSVKPVPFMTFSAALSERYPEPDLSQAAGETTDAMAKVSAPENRVPVGVRVMMDRLRVLEKAAHQRAQLFHRRDLEMIIGFASFLLVVGVITLVIVRRRRKVEEDEAIRHHFPDVDVAQRFAAPSGGGVVVEVSYKG